MKNANSVFGQVLSELRGAAALSQEELAHRSGIHRTYVSQVERGLKSPTITVVLQLSKALDTMPSEIMRLFENEMRK
ncbi:helix-turn-helix domain-containing protein [Bradyrhizobium erythrophlei]|uniref:DNA-binding transcriptional regulator, XRE-family HTH domain n=1 Tax=Bradyrhizobium erythrophlei TaxID=1437360 RepID=A0A1M5RNQ7_9BRAD|nr:helix-turn-helix transcriptional regulator [Bradyrhizobium erythrophlei]SHH27760.1 DNA-binding transcriptional regulator, XRE-family HTH domain [Bradyrhizobium erythrophlei]